jgi:hypothetical protein
VSKKEKKKKKRCPGSLTGIIPIGDFLAEGKNRKAEFIFLAFLVWQNKI